MQFFSRIALALFLTAASAFAEEVVPVDTDQTGIVPTQLALATEGATGSQSTTVADVTGIELASSETSSLAPTPWSETMSSFRLGNGSPEGTSSPNELREINWSDDKLVIGAGALIIILLLIILL